MSAALLLLAMASSFSGQIVKSYDLRLRTCGKINESSLTFSLSKAEIAAVVKEQNIFFQLEAAFLLSPLRIQLNGDDFLIEKPSQVILAREFSEVQLRVLTPKAIVPLNGFSINLVARKQKFQFKVSTVSADLDFSAAFSTDKSLEESCATLLFNFECAGAPELLDFAVKAEKYNQPESADVNLLSPLPLEGLSVKLNEAATTQIGISVVNDELFLSGLKLRAGKNSIAICSVFSPPQNRIKLTGRILAGQVSLIFQQISIFSATAFFLSTENFLVENLQLGKKFRLCFDFFSGRDFFIFDHFLEIFYEEKREISDLNLEFYEKKNELVFAGNNKFLYKGNPVNLKEKPRVCLSGKTQTSFGPAKLNFSCRVLRTNEPKFIGDTKSSEISFNAPNFFAFSLDSTKAAENSKIDFLAFLIFPVCGEKQKISVEFFDGFFNQNSLVSKTEFFSAAPLKILNKENKSAAVFENFKSTFPENFYGKIAFSIQNSKNPPIWQNKIAGSFSHFCGETATHELRFELTMASPVLKAKSQLSFLSPSAAVLDFNLTADSPLQNTTLFLPKTFPCANSTSPDLTFSCFITEENSVIKTNHSPTQNLNIKIPLTTKSGFENSEFPLRISSGEMTETFPHKTEILNCDFYCSKCAFSEKRGVFCLNCRENFSASPLGNCVQNSKQDFVGKIAIGFFVSTFTIYFFILVLMRLKNSSNLNEFGIFVFSFLQFSLFWLFLTFSIENSLAACSGILAGLFWLNLMLFWLCLLILLTQLKPAAIKSRKVSVWFVAVAAIPSILLIDGNSKKQNPPFWFIFVIFMANFSSGAAQFFCVFLSDFPLFLQIVSFAANFLLAAFWIFFFAGLSKKSRRKLTKTFGKFSELDFSEFISKQNGKSHSVENVQPVIAAHLQKIAEFNKI